MKNYNPKAIEAKWQKIWQETDLYKTPENPKKPFYNLVMFPYPSGDLHIGHWYNFAPADTLGRFARMQGYDVLQPLGYDAFGLPAENAAIKRGLPADEWTEKNITSMSEQLRSLGGMYDQDKMINTSQPEYYRWTQWLFLKLFHEGKAYQKEGLVNWCPNDRTVLANEQVVNGCCERCDTKVERKNLKQWYFSITDYADRLLTDLDSLQWPEKIKEMQKNWIGKSKGALIHFAIDGSQEKLDVYTTRPDTLFGATFMIIAPEHPLVESITSVEQQSAVNDYIAKSGAKTDIDRMEAKEKTGVFTGSYAVNPATNEQIPIWVSDYVLMGYGTGAIMAVPAHDERDFAFAKKYGLEIKQVIEGGDISESAHVGSGKLINSSEFDNLTIEEAKTKIIHWLESRGLGEAKTEYRLRDWLISRQRYWGAPIPIVYCDKCGVVPVPEKDLPVVLPLKQKFGKDGRSPLVDHPDFVSTHCPECGGKARRETDTMDTFVDSSWYFLRYPNTQYKEGAFDPLAVEKWLPVNRYIGGAEHAVLHLLYSRFITKFLYDHGHISFAEPFTTLINQGMILGPDGNKMSKSKGNVIDPDEYVGQYGADSVRLYLMFMGPYEDGGPWDPKRFEGTYRFMNKVYELIMNPYTEGEIDTITEAELEVRVHKLTKKVTQDINAIKFNTAIAAMMEFVNYAVTIKKARSVSSSAWQQTMKMLVLVFAPFAPYVTEELWEQLGESESVHLQAWPKYSEDKVKDDVVTIVVQVNGKVRSEFVATTGSSQAELEEMARNLDKEKNFTKNGEIVKVIVVPNRLVNFVVKP